MKHEGEFKETEIGKIPEYWENKRIGDVCQLVKEQFIPTKEDIRNYVGLEHIEQGTLHLADIGKSSEVDSNKLIFKKGQVLFGKLRPYFRKVYRPNFDGVCSTDIYVINAKKGYDNGFLFYFFANKDIIDEATNSSEGTRMPRASWNYLSGLERFFPPLPEQRAIAKILSDLDAKIELNRQTNATLEKMSEALFKQWFVDFEFPNEQGKPYKSSGGKMVESEMGEIPEGWEIGKLGDLVNNIKNPLKAGENLKGRIYTPIDKLSMRKIGLETYLSHTEAQSSLIAFEKDDILVGAMRIYFHRVNLAPSSGITRTTTFVLRPKKKEFLSYSLFQLNLDSTISYANAHSKGSTMPYAVWDGSLSNMKILMPSEEILIGFNKTIYPLLERMRDTIFEQQNLISIRDSLLPKLMSGQIRITM